MPEDGQAFSVGIVVEALVLPTILFEVVNRLRSGFFLRILFLGLIRFCRIAAMNRPVPVGRISPLFADYFYPFWTNVEFVRIFSKDNSWILTV